MTIFYALIVQFVEKLTFDGLDDFSAFKLKLFPVNDLTYFRNAIVYVNRNGFVVNDNVTPFSYPWGTSAFFFHPLTAEYAKAVGRPIGIAALRELMHTKTCDAFKHLKVVDGAISPIEFAYISAAQSVFRDAKQYFYLISRNVETYSDVAKSIGESIFYNDNDLYLAAVKIAKEHYGSHDLRTLPAETKLELSKRLHFEYNASAKQLQRLLAINSNILDSMF